MTSVPYFVIIYVEMTSMKLEFKYTNELVSYLLNIERYKTALEYLYLPIRTKQKLMYETIFWALMVLTKSTL